MKKLLLLVMSLVLLMAMMIPVFAADINEENKTGKTVVTYGVDGGFTVVIPADFNLTKGAETTQTVKASNVYLEYGKHLSVTMASDNYADSKWHLVHESDEDEKVEYTIGTSSGADYIESGASILTINAGTLTGERTLYFKTEDSPNLAGKYTDTLNFTVTVQNTPN